MSAMMEEGGSINVQTCKWPHVALRCQEYGLRDKERPLVVNGPFSRKKPSKEDDPGPPLNQTMTGSCTGSLADSTSQKKMPAGQLVLICSEPASIDWEKDAGNPGRS